jgi:hypothetical protein
MVGCEAWLSPKLLRGRGLPLSRKSQLYACRWLLKGRLVWIGVLPSSLVLIWGRRYDITVIIANGADLEVGFPANGIANKTATIKGQTL